MVGLNSVRNTLLLFVCFLLVALSLADVSRNRVFAESASESDTMLVNAGFEEDLADDKIVGWTPLSSGLNKNGSVTIDSSITASGEYSLRLDDNDNVVFGAESDMTAIEAGRSYTVTSSVYIASGSVQLQMRYYDSDRKSIADGIFVHNPDYQSTPAKVWQDISVTSNAPANAAFVSVVMASPKNGKGISYWDDVRVQLTDGVEEPEPESGLLTIGNSGFEETGADVSVIPKWKSNSGSASLTISTDNKRQGENSLRASFDPAVGGSAINLESDLIDIEENTTYILSAEVFLQKGNMEGLYVYVYDGNGALVKSSTGQDFHAYLNATTDHETWKYHERTFTVPPNGKKLKVSFITGTRRVFDYYVDEVSVIKQLTNQDMEQVNGDGSIPGWSKFKEGDAPSFAISSERASRGSSSLHLTNTPGLFLNVISELIPVESGATYTASARTWLEQGTSDMYVRFFDADRKYMSKQAWSIVNGPTDSWFDQYVTAVVPEGAQYAAVMFAGSSSKSYSYFIDDVKLMRGEHEVEEEPIPVNSITLVGEDLGAPIRKATLMRGAAGKDGAGRNVIYSVVAGAPSIFTVIDIATEKVVKSVPMPDTSGAWSVTVSGDGSVYLGAYNLGLLYRYIPSTDELINLGHPLPSKDSVLYPMAAGKDGIMYGSTYPTAHLYEYNPATNTFKDYGTMSTLNSSERWTRVVVYDEDTHKIYAGVGNVPRLLEYDLATGAKRDLLPAGYENITAVYDLNLADGKLFARKEANKANETFVIDVESGKQLKVMNADTGEVSSTFINFSRGVSPESPLAKVVYFAGTGGELFEFDLDTNAYRSLHVSIEGAAISYDYVQLNEEGFPGYSLVGLSGNSGKMYKYNLQTGKVKLTDIQVPAEPVNIHEIAKGPDGKIYAAGYLQGNLGVYTPSANESIYYDGIGQGEGMAVIHNKLYVGVYPGASVLEYDLSKPWNRTNADALNPKRLFTLDGLNQDRPFGMAGAEDLNKLFVGTVPKNGMLGGVLAVYDVATGGEPEVYENVVPDHSLLSFAYKDGLLYGGTSVHGGQGGAPTASEAVLYIWDVVNKKKLFETVPVSGKQAITALHVGPDGNIWGLANGALFIFDIETRQVIHSENAFTNATGRWIDGSMETGTDGNVYATVGGFFFKVDAATKEITVLASQVRKLAQDDFGSFYMFTEPETPTLYRYSIPELKLKLTGVEAIAEAMQLQAGQQTQLTLKGILEKGRTTWDMEGASKLYTSSNPAVAVVDSDGRVRAISGGTASITVQAALDGVTVESAPVQFTVTGDSGPLPQPWPEQPKPEQPKPEEPEPEKPQVKLLDIAAHWAEPYIIQAIEYGFVNGYEDQSFRPDNKVNRAEFAAMISRALQLEADGESMGFNDSNDIPDWAVPYVSALTQQGLLNGYEDNTFRPGKQMTRAEVIVMLIRALKLPLDLDQHESLSFKDADEIPSWALSAVEAAFSAGLINGRDDGKLAPNESITRAEAVTLLINMLKYMEKEQQQR